MCKWLKGLELHSQKYWIAHTSKRVKRQQEGVRQTTACMMLTQDSTEFGIVSMEKNCLYRCIGAYAQIHVHLLL